MRPLKKEMFAEMEKNGQTIPIEHVEMRIAVDFKPPCDCSICKQQYRDKCSEEKVTFAYLGSMTKDDVAKASWGYVTRIYGEQLFIHRAILDHGGKILRTWCRDRKSRQKIIDQVHTSIPARHAPILDIAHTHPDSIGYWDCKKSYSLPYTNKEDPRNLICLLHHRSQDKPSAWVPFDNAVIQAAFWQGAVESIAAEGCI